MDELSSRVPFGWAGIIDLTPQPTPLQLEHLASCFLPVRSSTAAIAWHGDGISALSLQHEVDSPLGPGSTSLRVPSAGTFQSVVHGWFFTPPAGVSAFGSLQAAMGSKLISDFAELGTTALTVLNGGWAAVIWDKSQQRAVFARDGVGFETLYVTVRGSQIVFASDLRIFRLAGLTAKYDEQAIAEFLHFLYVPSPRSIYKDVISVLPGHTLTIDAQGIRQERFAPQRFVRGVELGDEHRVHLAIQEYLPHFEDRLQTAVESCIPRQGRVGLLLSAGKDSSSLAVALKHVAPDRVVALTVASSDPQLDESGYAARLCNFLGISHRVYTPHPDTLLSGFQQLVASQDQPMGDPASLLILLASFDFPEDVSVIWDGTGTDYYFGWVSEADKCRDAKKRRFRRFIPGFAWPLFLWAMQQGPERFASTAREWRKPMEEAFVPWNGWSQDELGRLWQRDISWSDTHLYELIRNSHGKDRITLHTEALGAVWMPNTVIRKVTCAAHVTGRAGRMPFIDNRLAEFVKDLPQELKYQDYMEKTLLRAYLTKHVPSDLIQKPKRGFVSDHHLLLQSERALLPRWLREGGALQVLPSWSETYISRILSEYGERPKNYADKIYALSLLSLWSAISRGHAGWDGLSNAEF